MYVYLLQSGKKTYIGATVNLDRRLRQHNREIKGGAKYTTRNKGKWDYYAFILGCEKIEALSIEKKIHILSKKTKGSSPLERRIKCINNLLIEYPHLFLTIL